MPDYYTSTNVTVSVNGGSKIYDGTKTSDTTKYQVNLSSGLKTPVWTTDDFTLDGITSANANAYQVTLSSTGLKKLQDMNPNYAIPAGQVTAGKFEIKKAPATITVANKTFTYATSQ